MDTDYPPPRLPVHPVVTRDSFRGASGSSIPSVLDVSKAARFISGRFGLARALELCGVGSMDEVLVPAYSCPAMVTPIQWLGATAVFFKLHEDFSVDVDDVRRKISAKTKCLIAAHYFGFVQNARPLRELCDEGGIKLIEDCAHAFFGQRGSQSVGSYGDFAFASPMKFFPIYDGGCLVSAGATESLGCSHTSVGHEVKAFVNTLERSQRLGGFPARVFVNLAKGIGRRAATIVRKGEKKNTLARAPAALEGGYLFEERWMGVDTSLASRVIMSLVSQERLVRVRRANYRRLCDRFEALPGVRVLFPELSDGTVPYVFPLYVSDPDRVYPTLKRAGVPLLRWDDARTDACSLSALYARHLVMVPCHQELRPSDLEWICSQLEQSLAPTANSGALRRSVTLPTR